MSSSYPWMGSSSVGGKSNLLINFGFSPNEIDVEQFKLTTEPTVCYTHDCIYTQSKYVQSDVGESLKPTSELCFMFYYFNRKQPWQKKAPWKIQF